MFKLVYLIDDWKRISRDRRTDFADFAGASGKLCCAKFTGAVRQELMVVNRREQRTGVLGHQDPCR